MSGWNEGVADFRLAAARPGGESDLERIQRLIEQHGNRRSAELEPRRVTLCYPGDARSDAGRISVISA